MVFRAHEEDGEAGDETRDLFLITECWAEPQWGIITNCQFSALNGIAFSDVADKVRIGAGILYPLEFL